MSDFQNPIFHDEKAAREWLEARIWPEGPVCPHCGTIDQATLMRGKTTRPGLYQCNACREQFTATVGTVFERSKVPLHKWLLATYLMSSSKNGVSAHQIGRTLGVTYKTAWRIGQHIRDLISEADGFQMLKGHVEADETYVGGRRPGSAPLLRPPDGPGRSRCRGRRGRSGCRRRPASPGTSAPRG